ncbi:hypothetical protein ABT56_16150 [Photobacterium aquae]|uniref:SCP domain-containing protein n=1 Tax=Photobacterium aquae TaxID=1195763 RepID=A0A0J1GWP3_9GAMM|nr:CAP domain-containing protein [Photobacterium aquae]KLV04138.1 hypothetical protein ABT56_16150 [Photobacterium aquae]
MKLIPITVLFSALVLAGCGGGGGSDSSSTNSTGGNKTPTPTTPDNSGSVDSGSVDNGSTDTGNTGDNTNTNNGDDEVLVPGETFAEKMLFAVNQARKQQQNCGGEIMPAVPALTWNTQLEDAAQLHSIDMANTQNMSHTGSDGSDAGERISRTGYQYSSWAENVAYGQADIDAVMTAWMNSPGHCKNIMSSSVTEMGAGMDMGNNNRNYWTQVFARPR